MTDRELAHTASLHALVSPPSVSPGKRSPTYTPKELAKRINASLDQTIEAILRMSSECANAEDFLKGAERKEFFQDLNIGKPMFSKCVRVGRYEAFLKSTVKPFLPPSITTLYELSELDLKDLERLIRERKLTPETTRRDALALKAELRSTENSKVSVIPSNSRTANTTSKSTTITDDRTSIDRSTTLALTIEFHPNISEAQRASVMKWIESGRELPAIRDIR